MKREKTILLIIAAILASSLIIAGCVQDSGSNAGQTATGTPASPAVNNDGSHDNGGNPGTGQTGAGMARGNRGTGFLSNATLLDAAAGKLGVSEQDLATALNTTTNGRRNLTAAAEQLGVTPQQLTDALGFPANGTRRYGGFNGTPPAGQ